MQDLGILPGTLTAEATAVSGDGDVIYGVCYGPTGGRPFRWTETTGIQDVQPLGQVSMVQATNADGSVHVGLAGTAPYRVTSGGGFQSLGLLPNWIHARAEAVSADGSVVVGEGQLGGGASVAFRWTAATGLVALPAPPGGSTQMSANDVSADGSVIVGYAWAGATNRGFVWRAATGTALLPTSPFAGLSSICYGVTDDGRVAFGESEDAVGSGQYRAVLWDLSAGTMTFLLPPPTSSVDTSRVTCGNRTGSVLAGWRQGRAFGWSAQTGLVELGALGSSSYATGVNSDGTVIVGRANILGMALVRAFRYEFPGLGAAYCAGVPNSTGEAGVTLASGSSRVSDNDVTLHAARLPLQSFGFFLTGLNQGSIANPGGSQGTLCLQAPIGRFVGSGQLQNSGASGRFELALDLTRHPTPTGSVSVQSGQTWSFTAWYRDSIGGVPTSNFTSGLEIEFR